MNNNKGMGTIAIVVVVIIVIAIIAGAGAWYFMGGDEEEPTNGGPTNGDGNGNGDVNGGPGPAPDVIKIGKPSPISGPLAVFGAVEDWIAEQMESTINEDGGIYLSKYDERVPIEILIRDTESNPKTAASVGETLATKDQVDLFITQHTPATAVPISGVCEKNDIPAVATNCPIEPWLSGAPYEWTYMFYWSAEQVGEAFLEAYNKLPEDAGNKIGVLFPDGPDGRLWNEIQTPMWEDAGYEVVFTGYFPQDIQDFSSIISEFKSQDVNIIFGTLAAPIFHTFMRQCLEQNYTPEVVGMGKCCLFPAAMEALGDLSNGVMTEVPRHPDAPYESSLTGQTAQEWADAWEEGTGDQWISPIFFTHAAYEVAVDAIERAGCLEPDNIRRAIADTDMETIIGQVDFKDNPAPGEALDMIDQYRSHVSLTGTLVSQWVPGEKYPWEQRVVANMFLDGIPESDPIFPKPWPQ